MKTRTLDQVESTKRKAVRFVRDVLGDEERADEIEDESPEDYAERKRILIVNNPNKGGKTIPMSTATKAELEARVEELEAENEELVDKLNAITEVLNDEEDDAEDGEDGEEEDYDE